MIIYSLGFLFSPNFNGDSLLLIKKEKPLWQKGLINGIGGKLEENETINECMTREFKEETGIYIPKQKWKEFCVLQKENKYKVHCFKANTSFDILESASSKENEEIIIVSCIDTFLSCYSNLVPNLKWLISLAKSKDNYKSILVNY